MRAAIWLFSLVTLVGCATPRAPVDREAAARAAGAMARYRARIEAERPAPPPEWEYLPLRRSPEGSDGILREPVTDFIRIPIQP